ncbi:MAG: molybdopterin cofactor-binding domain-containing protein [Myxococcota bacterium]
MSRTDQNTLGSEAAGLSRRQFLTRGGAIVLGVGLTGCAPGSSERLPQIFRLGADGMDAEVPFAPDAFIRITKDSSVNVIVKHIEFGQGPYTGLTTLVADELDADWSQMKALAAPADDALYKNLWVGAQLTGGSTALGNSYYQMRNAGASARAMLVGAAAETWGVPASEISIKKGILRHAKSGREARFGDLIEAAAKQPLPEEPKLKAPEDFVFIGKETPKIDTAAKSDGSAMFTIDLYREKMLTVVVAHSPKFGGRVASFDATEALALPGVVEVQETPYGVAVYGEDTFAAIQGRRALKIEWDDSKAETRSSETMISMLREKAKSPGAIATERGDAAAAIHESRERRSSSGRPAGAQLEAEYVFPFLAHASMEPMDALIERNPSGEGVIASYGAQAPTLDQNFIAEILELPKDQVRVDVQIAGGSFGRRATFDSSLAKEAAFVFKNQNADAESRRPTKLLWTREDDTQGGYYRPIVAHRLSGSMSPDGKIIGWDQTIAAQSFVLGTSREASLKNGVDRTVVEGASDLAYATENLRVTNHLVSTGVPTLWWRSVGHTHTAFTVETFVDELLQGVNIDPVEGRLALLTEDPRRAAVLRRAAEMADWGRPAAAGRAFGVAVHKSFRSYVAQIVEIEVAESPMRPRVRKVWCAVDCGLAVNPNVVRAQMEGGIGFGLGAALYSEIHIDEGGLVREKNFDTYQNLRLHEMPEVEVAILPSNEDPSGVGEPGVPPIAPAVANAWRRLKGKRVSRLPIVRSDSA